MEQLMYTQTEAPSVTSYRKEQLYVYNYILIFIMLSRYCDVYCNAFNIIYIVHLCLIETAELK